MLSNDHIQLRNNVLTNEITSNLGAKRKDMTPYEELVLMKRFPAKPYLKEGEKLQLAVSLNISNERYVRCFSPSYNAEREGILRKYTSNLQ